MPADVAKRGRAQNRVGRGVADDVGVGVPEGAERRRDAHAAEDQGPALDEPVQIVPGADATGAAARVPAGGVEIGGRRDLHVGGVPRNHVHGVPGLLGEHRLVGRRGAGASERDGVAEHRAAEGLRRLREEDRLARQRLGHDAAAVHALHRVGDRTATIAAPWAAAASIDREIRSGVTNGRAAS